MAVAESPASGAQSGTRDRDTIYRRPPARPDTAWFGADGADTGEIPPADGSPDRAEPAAHAGAADPARVGGAGPGLNRMAPDPTGSGRISFGFAAGPISPVRHPASPTSPAGPSAGPAMPAASAADPAPPEWPGTAGAGGQMPARWPATAGSGTPIPAAAPIDPQRRLADTGERRYVLAEPPRPAPTGAPVNLHTLPEPPRQSRAVTVGIVLMSLFVLVAGSVVGVVYYTGSDDKLDSVLQLGAGEAGSRTVSAPLDDRGKATFEVLAATNRVRVTIGELGDELYRISTPEDSGIAPDPQIRNDDVKLQVTSDGDGTGGEIEIVLAAEVRWSLRFSGYAEEQLIDLSGGQISALEMVGGMRRAEITLARPSGTVPIKVNGAVEQLAVRSPAGSPVRVRVGGGAKTVVAGSRTLKNVTAGSTLTPKDWAAPNRYDLTAGAPITALTVGNT